LIGNPIFIPFCWHVDALSIDLSKCSNWHLQEINSLRNVERIRGVGKLTPQIADRLAAFPNLVEIGGPTGGFGGYFPASAWWKNYRTPLQPILSPKELPLLSELPHLEILDLAGDEFLVDDLDQLNALPSLKYLVLNTITATDEELVAFRDRCTKFKVLWTDHRKVDPWKVAQHRIARWRGENVPDPSSLSHRETLDLSGTCLTQSRLTQLKPFLSQIEDLCLGEVASPETAAKLFGLCPRLRFADLRFVPLAKRYLDSLPTNDGLNLHIQQGPMTAQELCSFVEKMHSLYLTIYGSTLTADEIAMIEDVATVEQVEAYRGYDDDEAAMIYPVAAEDDPDSPF
jgi:hypothetical protein